MAGMIFIIAGQLYASDKDLDRIQIYELQERCQEKAEQASVYGYADNSFLKIYKHRSHYNSRLNKCFMLESFSQKLGDPLTMTITDINEDKIYGFCEEQAPDENLNCNSQTWKEIMMKTMEE
jgi:hypothetical protein